MRWMPLLLHCAGCFLLGILVRGQSLDVLLLAMVAGWMCYLGGLVRGRGVQNDG